MYNRYPMNQNIIAESLALSCADGPMSYRTPDGRVVLCKGGGKGGKGVVGMVLGVVATVATGFVAAPLMTNAFGAGVMANVATGAVAGGVGAAVGGGDPLKGALLGGVGGGIMGGFSGGAGVVGDGAYGPMMDGGNLSSFGGAYGPMPDGSNLAASYGSGGTSVGLGDYGPMPDGTNLDGGAGSVGLNTGSDYGSLTGDYGPMPDGSNLSANGTIQSVPDAPAQATTDYTAPGASSQTTTTQPGSTLDAPPAADPQQTVNNAPSGGETKTPTPDAGGKGGPNDPWYKKLDWAGAGLKVGANLLGAQAQAPGAEDTASYLKDVQGMEKTAQNYNIASADKKAAIGDKLAVNAGAMDPNYYASQSQNATKNRGNAQKLAAAERMRAQGMDPQAINAELARMDIGNSQNEGTAYDSGYQTGVSNQNATYGAAGSMYGQIGQPSAGLASAYQANNNANSKAQEAAGNMIEQATGILTKTTKATPEKKPGE